MASGDTSNCLTRWRKAEAKALQGWASQWRLQKPSKALELGEPGNSKGQLGLMAGGLVENTQLGSAPFSPISLGAPGTALPCPSSLTHEHYIR